VVRDSGKWQVKRSGRLVGVAGTSAYVSFNANRDYDKVSRIVRIELVLRTLTALWGASKNSRERAFCVGEFRGVLGICGIFRMRFRAPPRKFHEKFKISKKSRIKNPARVAFRKTNS
jgi:hypothetical protein